MREALGVDDAAGLRERFARWETRRSPDGSEQWLNWVVRRDGRAVGWAQATVRGDHASVAYALLPDERGKGAASGAVRALVAWLRDELGIRDVRAAIAPDNLASQHVARAVGFTPGDGRVEGEIVWLLDAG